MKTERIGRVNLFTSLSKLKTSILGKTFSLLTFNERQKMIVLVTAQILLGFIDLFGVALVGILGALAVNGVQSRAPGQKVSRAINFLGLENQSFQVQVAALGILAAIALLSRTLFSVLLSRKTLFFLSRKSAEISKILTSKLFSKPLIFLQERNSQETLFALTSGVTTITMGVLGSTASLISDGSLLLIMAAGLLVVDPAIAVSTFTVFAVIGFAIYKFTHKKAISLGKEYAQHTIEGNDKILMVFNSYREAIVRGRRDYFIKEISNSRFALTKTLAEMSFMPNMSKYIIESTLVIGAVVISAVQFLYQDATHAVSTLTIFMAAGSRIAPAILRIQQGVIQIKGSLGSAEPTLDLITRLQDSSFSNEESSNFAMNHEGFSGTISASGIFLKYPNKSNFALANIDLQVDSGEFVAITGKSGAGKTSLIDVLLGVIEPSSGAIFLSDLPPKQTILKWPGAIGYVPQNVEIFQGTIKENLSFGYEPDQVPEAQFWKALKMAQLDEFVRSLDGQLDALIGERGANISGGQRQRLGIARALITNPKLLVLDEATSALDSQTEAEFTAAIQALKGEVTLVVIAHRLSTIKNADHILEMKSGKFVSENSI